MDESKVWRADAVGNEDDADYRPPVSGPDLDGILRQMIRRWLKMTGRSIDEIASATRTEARDVRKFLRGKPADLNFVTRICAHLKMNVGELFALSEDWQSQQRAETISYKRALLFRLENLMTLEEIQAAYYWHQLCLELPQFHVCLLTGVKLGVDMATDKGMDVSHLSRLVDDVWADRVAKAENRGKG